MEGRADAGIERGRVDENAGIVALAVVATFGLDFNALGCLLGLRLLRQQSAWP